MKSRFAVAAVLAAAFPGTALGAPGSCSSARPPAAGGARTLATTDFELVGLHWRGPGRVEYRTRSLAGRWSALAALAAHEDALPDAAAASGGRRTAGAWASP